MAKLLVVDDDKDILKLAKAVLTHENHEVLTAIDAIAAMDILNNQSIDLVISDANMPHYSGFDFINTLRKDSRFKDLPVAMLTGLREKKDIEKAIRVGVNDYIIKPLDPLIFTQKIADILEKNPPKTHPQIEFPPDSERAKGTVEINMKLVSISEVSISFTCTGEIEIGEVIEINCAFFRNEIGEAPPPLKVLDREPHHEGWLYTMTYLGARESYFHKVRKWIFTHGHSRKAA